MHNFIWHKILILTVLFSLAVKSFAQNLDDKDYAIKIRDALASVRAGTIDNFDPVATRFHDERIHFGNELLAIFRDPHCSQGTKGAAAYYLGEIRFAEATDVLATNIALYVSNVSDDHLYPLEGHLEGFLSARALIKIGVSAVQPVIRNLENSDDETVRSWSMMVLCRIEADKDVVQLRLQKALTAEQDSRKQARLRAALKDSDQAIYWK